MGLVEKSLENPWDLVWLGLGIASPGGGCGSSGGGVWGCLEWGLGLPGAGSLERGRECCLGEVAAPHFHVNSVGWSVWVLFE